MHGCQTQNTNNQHHPKLDCQNSSFVTWIVVTVVGIAAVSTAGTKTLKDFNFDFLFYNIPSFEGVGIKP